MSSTNEVFSVDELMYRIKNANFRIHGRSQKDKNPYACMENLGITTVETFQIIRGLTFDELIAGFGKNYKDDGLGRKWIFKHEYVSPQGEATLLYIRLSTVRPEEVLVESFHKDMPSNKKASEEIQYD